MAIRQRRFSQSEESPNVRQRHSTAAGCDVSPATSRARKTSVQHARSGHRQNAVDLSNVDLVTLALFALGGKASRVDTEDVAKKASQVAPGRLAWRKYPDQINLELVRVFLSDAKKASNGTYVIGSGRTGWMLTHAGSARAAQLAASGALPGFASPRATTASTKRDRAERAWLLGHPALDLLRTSGVSALSARELESLFRVDEYIVGAVRERRIARVLNSVAEDPELVALLSPAAQRVRSVRGA